MLKDRKGIWTLGVKINLNYRRLKYWQMQFNSVKYDIKFQIKYISYVYIKGKQIKTVDNSLIIVL